MLTVDNSYCNSHTFINKDGEEEVTAEGKREMCRQTEKEGMGESEQEREG